MLEIITTLLGVEQPVVGKELKDKVFPVLYALSKNGNIRTYTISVLVENENLCYIKCLKTATIGGAQTEDSYPISSGVNIGKANETTPYEQAMKMAESIFKGQLDKGYKTTKPKGDFNTDARGYIKPMLASGFDEKRIVFPCIVQPKYDGVRCIITLENDEVRIVSRNGKRYNIPHLEKYCKEHDYMLPLDGELYNHKELTFQEIISAVKKVSELTDKICFVAYDTPIPEMDFLGRGGWAKHNVKNEFPILYTEQRVCNSIEEIDKSHDEFVKQGYEGAIIRNTAGMYEFGFRSKDLIKYKKFNTEEFKIVDVVEATGRDAGTAILVCTCKGGEFRAKPQGDHALRSEYFSRRKELIGKEVTVQYQGLTDAGIPRFPSAVAIRDYE